MSRARKPCGEHGCSNLDDCIDHKRVPWQRETKRSRLSGSAQQKRSRWVIERDGTICHRCGYAGADQADHVIPIAEGGLDDVSNMRAIHKEPCHREKTAAEAARGRHAH